MKKVILKSALLAIASIGLMTNSAMAVIVDIGYTADNFSSMWFIDDIDGMQSLGSNYNNWQLADFATVDLNAGQSYSLVWNVNNFGAYSAGNPAGFLAEIDLGTELVLSSIEWSYSANTGSLQDFDSAGWSWGAVSSYGTNGGNNIWTNNFGGPIAGISTDAEWIWSENNFADGTACAESLWIRTDFTTADPVPEPATMLLFGTGLAGLAGLSRKKSKKV